MRVRSVMGNSPQYAWSPSGHIIATLIGSHAGKSRMELQGGTLSFLDPVTDKELRTIEEGKATSFACSPDGTALAVSTSEGIQLWGVPNQPIQATVKRPATT